MGHELARATPAAALVACVLLTACGGGDGGDPPPVLDNARDQVVAATVAGTATTSSVPSGSSLAPPPEELPPPDPSTFEGANRVVNLWVGADGETGPVDVWGRRTFTNGPILLVEDLPFGAASDYFTAPTSYSLVVVNSGAGPDGVERAGLFNAANGEQITTLFTNDDDDGAVAAPNLFETGTAQAPSPPSAGSGVVWLTTANIRAFSDQMIETVGGDAFYVGDGSTTCRAQRQDDPDVAPSVLGGTQTVELELDPGPAVITLHPWFSPDQCEQTAVSEFVVDVAADESQLVIVYTPDGTTLETLTLPVRSVG